MPSQDRERPQEDSSSSTNRSGNSAGAGAHQPHQQHQQQDQNQPLSGQAVWWALGRAAGTTWTALKLCHQYVLAPAAVWVLRNLKAYIEEQLAIQRAMDRPCPVRKYGDGEVRRATDNLGFTRRVLGTPYGMVVYLTELREIHVAIRQIPLNRMEDVEVFWREAAAGAALLSSSGRHAHVVPYLGCCPHLACHVYEQRPGTCSLREALQSSSRYGSALSSWEARLVLCQQLVFAVVHLLQLGISARELSASHVILKLGGPAGGGGEGVRAGCTSTSTNTSCHMDRAPHCWLAPGCGFRAETSPSGGTAFGQQRPPQPAATLQGRYGDVRLPAATAAACGRPGVSVAISADTDAAGGDVGIDMGRAVGQLLMQVLADTDSPVPLPSVVLRALAEMAPSRLLAPAVAPPLTDDQAWPLMAAVYSLLNWGQEGRKETDLGPYGSGHAAGAARAASPVHVRGATGGGSDGVGASHDWSKALQSHLQREVLPALSELTLQLQTATVAAAAARRSEAGPGPFPMPWSPSEDAFTGASAPPLPFHPPGAATSSPAPEVLLPAAAAAIPNGGPLGGRPTQPPPRPAATTVTAATSPWPPAAAAEQLTPVRTTTPVQAACGSALCDGLSSRPGPPEELLCPITTELMEDPVVAADGHSYERHAIARWFAGCPGRHTSPLTGAMLPHTGLTPNYALRKIIADWREKHGE